MAFLRFGLEPRCVAHIGTSVIGRIGIEYLLVPATLRNAQTVNFAWNWGEVANGHQKISRIQSATDIGEDRVTVVVAIDPFESCRVKIDLMHGWFTLVEVIQVGNQPFYPLMRVPLEQVPL